MNYGSVWGLQVYAERRPETGQVGFVWPGPCGTTELSWSQNCDRGEFPPLQTYSRDAHLAGCKCAEQSLHNLSLSLCPFLRWF